MSQIIKQGAERWFLETSFPGVRRAKRDLFRIDKEIFRGKTPFQNIYIFESPGFGKILCLDGIIQLSQSDEFIYHEIIAHVPLLTHPHPGKMMVIGGGDGGVLREATKHPLKEIHFVEIDKEVVALCRKYLPFISKGAFDEKRVKVFITDGMKFIKEKSDFYDVIVVDSTDPVGPGKVLFTANFYRMVSDALTKDGIAIFQLGPFLDFDLIIKPTAQKLRKFFKYVNPVRLAMPSYSCGCEYCFLMASKTVDPSKLSTAEIARRLKNRLGKKADSLRYYAPEVHAASLAMPVLWRV